MDRLLAMQVFSAVVEAGAFARAADRLTLSTSAVSRHVADLERHLGARLLQRSTRRLSLTETGAAYYERCRQILADVDEAESLAADAEARPHGLLRVSLPHSFGLAYVAPLLPDFCARYPELELEVGFSDRVVDLVAEGIDLALRIGLDLRTTLVARRLATIRIVPCAAPDYLARRGSPATPADLKQHDCLTYAYAAFGDVWKFERDGTEHAVTVKGRIRADSGEMLRLMTLAGHGISLQPTFLMGEDLRAGRLLRLLPDYDVIERHLYAVYLGGARRSARVRAFVSFFATAFGGAAPPWDQGIG